MLAIYNLWCKERRQRGSLAVMARGNSIKWRNSSRLSKDEIAELLTKNESDEWKNTQNILLDGCHCIYLLRSMCKEYRFIHILKVYRKTGKCLQEGKKVQNLKDAQYMIWRIMQILQAAVYFYSWWYSVSLGLNMKGINNFWANNCWFLSVILSQFLANFEHTPFHGILWLTKQ